MIAAAEVDQPGAIWLARDLAVLDLAADGIDEGFDLIVSAGNVMTFLDPATRGDVLRRLGQHLASNGRLVVGFGADRGYHFDEFFADAESAGLHDELRLSSWDLRPFGPSSTFLVAVLTNG